MSNPRIILGVSSTQIFKNQTNDLILYNNNADIITITNNGNVGISVTNPTEKLSVSGNVLITGDLTVNGTTTNVSETTINIEDPVLKLAHNNDSNIIDTGVYDQYVENGVTFYTGLIRTSSNNQYNLINTTNIPGITINDYNFSKINTGSLTIKDNGTRFLTMKNNNNNTTFQITNIDSLDPNRIYLGVSGKLTTYITYEPDEFSVLSTVNTNLGGGLTGNGNINWQSGNITFDSGTGEINFSNDFIVNENNLVVNTSSNKVGIGITNPDVKLHVSGDFKINNGLTELKSQNSDIVLQYINTSSNLVFNSPSTNNTKISNSTGGYLSLGVSSVEVLYVKDGNIGIGDSTPSYQLELSTDSAAKPVSALWTISSDKRLKDIYGVADYKLCYNNIKKLDLKYYKWKDEYIREHNIKDEKQIGWIADDVEKIFKKAVNIIDLKNNKYNSLLEDRKLKTLSSEIIYRSMYGALKQLINDKEKIEENINKISLINEENIKKEDIISDHIFEKIETPKNMTEKLKNIFCLQYIDKNNNKNQYSEEENIYNYALSNETIENFFNILSIGNNKYLPTINRYGKIIDYIIEIYNHNLKENDIILIKINIDDKIIETEIEIDKILDTTHIIVKKKNIEKYFDKINNKKILLYGKKIENFKLLNKKFLYSISSFNLATIKELNENIEDNKNTLDNINNKLENNVIKLKSYGESYNKLINDYTIFKNAYNKSIEKINSLSNDNIKLNNMNQKLIKQINLNNKNILQMKETINKQNKIINIISKSLNLNI